MHAGVQNAEAAMVEIAADAGKQVGLVRVYTSTCRPSPTGETARPHDGLPVPTWRDRWRVCQAMSVASWRMK
jgi:hypothetical protein